MFYYKLQLLFMRRNDRHRGCVIVYFLRCAALKCSGTVELSFIGAHEGLTSKQNLPGPARYICHEWLKSVSAATSALRYPQCISVKVTVSGLLESGLCWLSLILSSRIVRALYWTINTSNHNWIHNKLKIVQQKVIVFCKMGIHCCFLHMHSGD